MAVDRETLRHLKKLCKIECTPEEDWEILNNLSRVLQYMEQLKSIDTENVEPCRHVLRAMLKNRMRDDAVKDVLPRALFLANASDEIGGLVRVPPVMKQPQ